MVFAQNTSKPRTRRSLTKEPVEQQADENGTSTSVVNNLNKLHIGTTSTKSQITQQQNEIMKESNILKGKVVKQKIYEAKAKKRQQMLEKLAAEDKEKLARDAVIRWLNTSDQNPVPIVEMELNNSEADETVAEPAELDLTREGSSIVSAETTDEEEYEEELCELF